MVKYGFFVVNPYLYHFVCLVLLFSFLRRRDISAMDVTPFQLMLRPYLLYLFHIRHKYAIIFTINLLVSIMNISLKISFTSDALIYSLFLIFITVLSV